MTRTTTINTNFPGAAGPLSASWTDRGPVPLNQNGSGSAYPSSNGSNSRATWNVLTPANDQFAEITMLNASSPDQEAHLMLRATGVDATFACYFLVFYPAAVNAEIYECEGGTFTLRGDFGIGSITWNAGDKLSAEVVTNVGQPVITIFKDTGSGPVQLGSSFTDTLGTPRLGGDVGFGGFQSGAAGQTLVSNFAGGDFVAAAGTTQQGAASIGIITGSSQSYTPAGNTATTQNGAATVVVNTATPQGYNIRASTAPDELVRIFGAQAGTPWASQGGITWQWQDTFGGPILHSGTDATDGAGLFSVRIPATALDNGQGGRLTIEIPDGNPPLTWPRQVLYLPVSYG